LIGSNPGSSRGPGGKAVARGRTSRGKYGFIREDMQWARTQLFAQRAFQVARVNRNYLTVPTPGRYRKVPKGQAEALCFGRCRNPKQRGISMHTDDASRQGHVLVTNLHFLEKAVVNAFELVSLLFGPVCAGRVAPTLPGARPGCSIRSVNRLV
jgi:hypothetical protein